MNMVFLVKLFKERGRADVGFEKRKTGTGERRVG